MRKLINILVLTYKHCQSIRMTGEAKPSEKKTAKSELSVSEIAVEKRGNKRTIWHCQILWQN